MRTRFFNTKVASLLENPRGRFTVVATLCRERPCMSALSRPLQNSPCKLTVRQRTGLHMHDLLHAMVTESIQRAPKGHRQGAYDRGWPLAC